MSQTKPTLALAVLLLSGTLTAYSQSHKVVADKIITIVGDRIILYSDIQNAVADAARQNNGSIPADAICTATEQALISKVLMLRAEKDSLIVTDEEVEAELEQRFRYFSKLLGGPEAICLYAGTTIAQLKEKLRPVIRENQLAANMQRKILMSVKVTPSEVRTFFEQIPADSLPFFESEMEIGVISIYPKISAELENYTIGELNNYRRQAESKSASFEQLGSRFSEHCGNVEKDGGLQYVLYRNEKGVDAKFLSAVFKMQKGEISAPIKTPTGYFLVQLLEKDGDEAIIRHIFKKVPVSDEEIGFAKMRLDSLRPVFYSGRMAFSQIARKYDESKNGKNGEYFLLNPYGSTFLTADQLDKETALALSKTQLGDFSAPFLTKDEDERAVIRMIFLQSRSRPHRMNLEDDYNRIAEAALSQKQTLAMSKWIREMMAGYAIVVDPEFAGWCRNLPVNPAAF